MLNLQAKNICQSLGDNSLQNENINDTVLDINNIFAWN
jgi:hypothetical protein